MPLLANYINPFTPESNRPRLAAAPGYRSLTFLRPYDSGRGSRAKWGEPIYGWNEITPAGRQADVVIPRSSDEFIGFPMVTSASPTTGQVQINVDPRSELNVALAECWRGVLFEMRHIMAPPNMHLHYAVYLFHGSERTAVANDSGMLYNLSITPFSAPLEIAGGYYQSGSYDQSDAADSDGVLCNLLPQPVGLPNSEFSASLGLQFSTGGGLDLRAGRYIPRSPTVTNAVQAMVYAPQIGYALSTVDSAGGNVNYTDLNLSDGPLAVELARSQPGFFVGVWDVPAQLQVLR